MSDNYDVVVIGAGASGEAAADYAALRGASVALIEKDLVGGSCAYWACMPSKALLHAAEVRAAGGEYPWPKASAFRDWMINRTERPYPDDTSHARGHERAGVTVVRATSRVFGGLCAQAARDLAGLASPRGAGDHPTSAATPA